MQLDREYKGFSFSKEGPLDMRMDPNQSLTAGEIVNKWPEEKLGEIFKEYGEEPRWRKAAKVIVSAREDKAIDTTKQLADLLSAALGKLAKKRLHPATLIFQALRIFVNQELEAIQKALAAVMDFLNVGGRIGVMSFHSLEDRIVKSFFKESAMVVAQNKYREYAQKQPLLKLLHKKPQSPSAKEIKDNPRSRSAKLRFAERLGL